MLLKIITLEKTEWSGDIDSVTLPTTQGEITILPGHSALVSTVEAGEVTIHQGNTITNFFITEGCVQIIDNEISVLADLATKAQDLTEARVEEARQLALDSQNQKDDDVQFASIEANLRRELAKEKIIQKYKIKIK